MICHQLQVDHGIPADLLAVKKYWYTGYYIFRYVYYIFWEGEDETVHPSGTTRNPEGETSRLKMS